MSGLHTLSGKIILLNGASSSGKSTLARALQGALDEPFWHFSIDHLIAANVLPMGRIEGGEFSWRDMRPQFFDGFHRCLPALAGAGNNLIVEYIVEQEAWMHVAQDGPVFPLRGGGPHSRRADSSGSRVIP